MVGFLSLARLGVGLAVFLLQASDAVLDPSPSGVFSIGFRSRRIADQDKIRF